MYNNYGDKMIKICFVCLGNICRSPMAEFIMKEECRKNNLDNIYIESKATSFEEEGNDMYYLAKDILDKHNIPYSKRKASRLNKDDYNKFDLIIGMEDSNIYNIMRIIENDKDKKVYKLLDFSKIDGNISDPWYTRDFEKAYDDINKGVLELINYIKNIK